MARKNNDELPVCPAASPDKQKRLLERGPVPAVVLALIAMVCVTLLALTANLTEDARALQRQIMEDKYKLVVFPEADTFKSDEPALAGATYLNNNGIDLREITPNVTAIHLAYKDGEILGFIVALTSNGYSGGDPLEMMVGYNTDGSLRALSVDVSTQTSGIGDKVARSEYLEQFKALKAGDLIAFNPTGDQIKVDAVSGATESSTGVINGINEASQAIAAILAGDQGGQHGK